jgi:hypothetical protein
MSDDDAHLLIGRALGQTWRRADKSESSVCIPPALIVVDSDGAVWTLGFSSNAFMEFNVLRNDIDVGEFASKIEYLRGVVTLYSSAGRKQFSRNRRHII